MPEQRRTTLLRLFGIIAVTLSMTACRSEGAGEVDPYSAPGLRTVDSSVGASELFARECAWCHGSKGAGTSRAPNLDGELDGAAYTHFMLASGRMPITDPKVKVPSSTVVFSDEQIQALADYVAGFGGTGPGIPSPDPTAGDLTDGEQLYVENCAACHSATGTGRGLPTGIDAPALLDADITPVIIAEAMAIGPGCRWPGSDCGIDSGIMPRFEFTDQQVDDITAYVQFLQSEGDPGGWNLGRIGPVAEGAAAVVLGGGLILAALLWIGTRVGEE